MGWSAFAIVLIFFVRELLMPLLLRSIVCSCFLLLLCIAIFCLFVTMWEFFVTGAVRLVIVLLCTLR